MPEQDAHLDGLAVLLYDKPCYNGVGFILIIMSCCCLSAPLVMRCCLLTHLQRASPAHAEAIIEPTHDDTTRAALHHTRNTDRCMWLRPATVSCFQRHVNAGLPGFQRSDSAG